MRIEAHTDVSHAKLRGHELARHAVGRFDGGRTFLVAQGMGLPRTHAFATGALIDGFADGLSKAGPARGRDRLRKALASAKEMLLLRAQGLIEREIPDVAFVAVIFDGGELSLASAGPCRAYVTRRSTSERLTPPDEPETGLLGGTIFETTFSLEPSDLVFAGSVSAFSTQAVARVASVLRQDPEAPPSVLATLLTEPAGDAGVGAAVVVLRAG